MSDPEEQKRTGQEPQLGGAEGENLKISNFYRQLEGTLDKGGFYSASLITKQEQDKQVIQSLRESLSGLQTGELDPTSLENLSIRRKSEEEPGTLVIKLSSEKGEGEFVAKSLGFELRAIDEGGKKQYKFGETEASRKSGGVSLKPEEALAITEKICSAIESNPSSTTS